MERIQRPECLLQKRLKHIIIVIDLNFSLIRHYESKTWWSGHSSISWL